MKSVLVTNDDGYEASGLGLLASVLREYFKVVVVAPEVNQSYVGHSVTVGTDFTLVERGEGVFSLNGRPADCVRVGLKVVAPDVSWVFSGVNNGANLGADVFSSGTVAAVREGVLCGVGGAAISQYRRSGTDIVWEEVRPQLRRLVEYLHSAESARGEFFNVNLPHPLVHQTERIIKECELDLSPHDISFSRHGETVQWHGVFQNRKRVSGRDVSLCIDDEFITVSRLRLPLP
jgi:5'-nucleotidase